MLYAKIVLGLAVEGPFDYIVPDELSGTIKVGARAWVNFRNQRMLGYVVGLTHRTAIKNLKRILGIIDLEPVLDRGMLLLTRQLSDYYCCSWGQAIESALPEHIRQGKMAETVKSAEFCPEKKYSFTLIQDKNGSQRWDFYLKAIQDAYASGKSAIVLLPDMNSALKARDIIVPDMRISPAFIFRKQPNEAREWAKIKEGKVNIVLGVRSAIFAPLFNLGLVIVDEEQDESYKQDQVPHYNARDVALMRVKITGGSFIMGSRAPSLESYFFAKKNKIRHIVIPEDQKAPEIKIINNKSEFSIISGKDNFLSKYLEDSISGCLDSAGKVLLLLNRRGFATYATCASCGIALKCPRCNVNLVYHFKEAILNCHYCNFKMPAPQICPHCNSGYIKYSGAGIEKIESELSRIFVRSRIKRLDAPDKVDLNQADIFVATQPIVKLSFLRFDLVGVLAFDNYLNRVDFRAAEKGFRLLTGLCVLTEKKLIIQSQLSNHHCFRALIAQDWELFYREELRQRKDLGFPPFKHFAIVKLRGANELRVMELSAGLFEKLNKENKTRGILVASSNRASPAKLRGKFCWQILMRGNSAEALSRFLRKHLKEIAHSGIIITVDVDPV